MATSQLPGKDSENLKEFGNVAVDSKIVSPGTQEVINVTNFYGYYTPPIGPKDDKYKMDSVRRGKAIIFNHEKFHEARNLKEREGTTADVNTLNQCLKKFKFDVEVFNDLSVADISKQLEEVQKQDHKDKDCILVAVLTHGKNDLGKDKLYAHDFDYDVDDLWKKFTANMCPSLAGKPKIFIIQACRGERASEQLRFKSASNSNKDIQEDSARVNESNNSHRYSIPVEADILIAFSTFEGHVAHRNTQEGSWFIQELCNELENNGEKLDLLSMFTNVNRRVAIDYQYKQMPVIQSTLTRKVFLNSAIEDEQTLVANFNNALGETNEKLDQIIKMFESAGPSSVVKRRPKKQILTNWNGLQTPLQPIDIAMPAQDSVFKHAELLQMFLEEDPLHLPSELKENGTLILNLLSCWEHLTEEMKQYAYKNLVIFLNENARNWRMYKFLDIPETSALTSQRCHRRWSHTDVTDSGSSRNRLNKTGSLPRKR